MAMLPQAIDPNQVEPSAEMGPVPDGEYLAEIIDSQMKDSRKGGQYLALTYKILDGQFAGRHVWHNLNLVNANETAVRIAQQQLSAICHACGYMQPVSDSAQLHQMPHVIKVVLMPPKGEYQASNNVKGWKKADGQAPRPIQTGPAPAQVAPQPAAAGGKPPWAG